jgi:uncharacterized UPF0160 family protein
VLAFALIKTFVDGHADVIRTRESARLDECDIVIDVGGVFDAGNKRFDHHQKSDEGDRSSAGMVLDWLVETQHVERELADHLRHRAVNYIDAVDTGREAPEIETPCLARIVEAIGQGHASADEQDAAFLIASSVACAMVDGLNRGFESLRAAREAVVSAMHAATDAGEAIIFLDRYYPWKPIYFEHDGIDHATDYVAFPSDDATWKLVAIPPRLGCFDQKRPLPESWAGRLGEELEAATGVPGSVFCHKNRFIAVFRTRAAMMAAAGKFGLLHRTS